MKKENEMKELIVYKENKPYVTKKLKDGEVDFIETTEWSFIDNFFGFLISNKFLEWAQKTYPTPRKKEDIPVWFLIACKLQMKLHTTASFNTLPGILNSGSILTSVKFNVGQKNGGFNNKNKKERTSAVNQDTVRKYYKDADAKELENWLNTEFIKWLREKRCFDKKGIFIMDHTYLPLPENENYEKAELMPLGSRKK